VVRRVGAATDEIPVVAVVAVVVALPVAFVVLVIAGAVDDDEVAVVVDSVDGGGNERRKEEVPLLECWYFLFLRALLGCPHWDQIVASMDAYLVTYYQGPCCRATC
jgi:hypothetical protein